MQGSEARDKTILLCDDDFDFRYAQKIQLEALGYRVLEAETGKQAEEVLEKDRPDLLVVDLIMEEKDTGFTLCYHAKKRYPALPIIMVTGAAAQTGFEFDTATSEERAWIKADALLNKPIRFEQLEREIARLLNH